MSIQQIKEILHTRIDQLDDGFLRVLYAMLESYMNEQEGKSLDELMKNVPRNPEWKALTEDELLQRLDKSSAQIEKGETISLEELETEMKNW